MTDHLKQKFEGKTLLLTGGTGSFGNAVLNRFIDTDIAEIRIFSRDEKKQDDMRHIVNSDKLTYFLGDVRNRQSIDDVMAGVDFVFHAAALKQVPSCEFFPMQAYKTNVEGSDNTVRAAIEHGVQKFVLLSTDKAVYPINAMGMSKAMAEKVVRAASRNITGNTILNITRYGNVMASRGSVIPLFVGQAKRGEDITITDPTMTRFMMSLQDAVDLVLYAFINGGQGETFVQKAPACTVADLAQAIVQLFGSKSTIKVIGTRPGEKRHETLLTREEYARSEELHGYYRIPADGDVLHGDEYEYTSENTRRLNVEQTIELLQSIDYIQYQLAGDAGEKGLV